MKTHFLITLILSGMLVSGCSKSTTGSRLLNFNYSGYGDTTQAALYGKVYEIQNNNNDTVPLRDVLVAASYGGKTTGTDSTGGFELWFDKGEFALVLTKKGYQSLTLTNYIAEPDQVSFAKIIMLKGEGMCESRIKDR